MKSRGGSGSKKNTHSTLGTSDRWFPRWILQSPSFGLQHHVQYPRMSVRYTLLHNTTPRSIGRQLTCSIKPAQWSTPSVKKKDNLVVVIWYHLGQQIQITLYPDSLSQMRSNPHYFFFWTERLASSSIEKCQMSERAHLLCRHVLSSYLLYSLPPISHFKVFVFNVLFKKLKNISHI